MPAAAPKAQRKPFPRAPDEFQHDDRVSFDKRENKWILEDHDGSEWEYSDALGKWMPSVRPLT
jgi:HIV Tat-specific factor 1